MRSGVGWESKVFGGHGGLALDGRSALRTVAQPAAKGMDEGVDGSEIDESDGDNDIEGFKQLTASKKIEEESNQKPKQDGEDDDERT